MARFIDKKILYYIICVYFLLATSLTFWWGTNWRGFEGDELFSVVAYLLILTTLFYLVQWLFIRRLKYLTVVLLPFATILTSYILGVFFLGISGIDARRTNAIYVYGIIYLLTNVLDSVLIIIHMNKAQQVKD